MWRVWVRRGGCIGSWLGNRWEGDHWGDLGVYLLTPWSRVLLEKLTGLQLVKKFPAFHGTRKFITAFTSARHLSLSWASPIQSIYPHLTSWRSILILSTHLRLGLPSGLLPIGFPTKTLYTPLSSPIRATCPTHLILLDFISRTILSEEYNSFSSSIYTHIYIYVCVCFYVCVYIYIYISYWKKNSSIHKNRTVKVGGVRRRPKGGQCFLCLRKSGIYFQNVEKGKIRENRLYFCKLF